MARVRVYTLAKELGMENFQLIEKLKTMGIEVSSHMSAISDEAIAQLRGEQAKPGDTVVVEKRVRGGAIRRRKKVVPKEEEAPAQVEETEAAAEAKAPVEDEAEPEAATEQEAPAEDAAAEQAEGETAEAKADEGEKAPEEEKPDPTSAAKRAGKSQKPAARIVGKTTIPVAELQQRTAPGPGRGTDQPHHDRGTPRPEEGAGGMDAEIKRNAGRRRVIKRQTDTGPKKGMRLIQHAFGGRVRQKKRKRGSQKETEITTPKAIKRRIEIEGHVTAQDLAHKLGLKVEEVLRRLRDLGAAVDTSEEIDDETAVLVASEFGYEVVNVAVSEEDLLPSYDDADDALKPRSAVVTVMGHVDHGKTSLLDFIRKSRVAAKEAGGITQHIGAYKVKATGGGEVVFLDTPGHAAFTAMRARGAQATDIVVLVVAADDGVMPQTKEAIDHAKAAGVPIVVAINKMDLADADPEKVTKELSVNGVVTEAWGGDAPVAEVSAATGAGIPELLEQINLQAELLELKANPDRPADGVVIESKVDKGRGPVATLLVQGGTLNQGDVVAVGEQWGKVRAMVSDTGERIKTAGPSTPVEIIGLQGVPVAGDGFYVVKNEAEARNIADHIGDKRRREHLAKREGASIEELFSRAMDGEKQILNVVIKADVAGSAEAIEGALLGIEDSRLEIKIISSGVGAISESDIMLASTTGATVIGFSVRPDKNAVSVADQEGIDIKLFTVIYDLLDHVKSELVGMLAPEKREIALGKLEVRETYRIRKLGTVAGSFVTEGKITRGARARLVRDSAVVHEGKIGTLRRFKDDVDEVANGYECGFTFERYNDIKAGDVVEIYEVEEVAATL